MLVGMDGYHLGQSELRRLRRAEREGAPDTFHAAATSRCCAGCTPDTGIVYAPECLSCALKVLFQ